MDSWNELFLPSITSSSPKIQACIHGFIQEFLYHHTHHSPSTALHMAVNHTNALAAAMGLPQIFQDNSSQVVVAFQQAPVAVPRQTVLSTMYTNTKLRFNRIMSITTRLAGEIREFTIGIGSFSVKLTTGHIEDSCYIEYVPARQRWRTALCPSAIPLRLVQHSELSPGCRQLITTAGCVFKTSLTTPYQQSKPIGIQARSVRSVMQSLGFCAAEFGTVYRVFSSRIGRSIKAAVTIVPHVNQNGENVNDGMYVEGGALMANVGILYNESVGSVVHRVRVESKKCVMSLEGREIVCRKLRGEGCIVLI